jgi:ABC-type phosphate transport system, periplasmic component
MIGKAKCSLILAALLITGTMTGCGNTAGESITTESQSVQADERALHLEVKDYPKVDGSTATIPLSEAVGAAVMGMSVEDARQYILHNTTHNAYLNLVDRKADIIFVTAPSQEELDYAKNSGVKLEIVPIVSEGFVFLVSRDNPVNDLSMEQIRGIYSGKIKNWKDVGGENKKIIAYQRPLNSGSQTGMLELVMDGNKMMDAPTEKVIAEMGSLVDAVAVYKNDEYAIGYSYYYYVTDMWENDKVKLLKVDGVYPDKKSISDGSYPVRTAYYAVLRADEPMDCSARKLLKWILGGQGQQVAEEAGYVRLGN